MVDRQRSDLLKLIAIVSMLIDHVGYTFFPQYSVLRIIGRLAFPIFAYQIAQGYLYTSDKRNYTIRLWIFAALSQGPFSLLFQTTTLNVIVTLGLALFAIDCYEKKRYFLMMPVMAVSFFVPMDYGLFGVLMALGFYMLRERRWILLAVQTTLIFIFTNFNGWLFEYYAIVSPLMILFLPVNFVPIRLNKYFFYWFYPVHLTILYLIQLSL